MDLQGNPSNITPLKSGGESCVGVSLLEELGPKAILHRLCQFIFSLPSNNSILASI